MREFQKLPVSSRLPALTTVPHLTVNHLGAAEGVVELVDGEEGAHAEVVDLGQTRVDLGSRRGWGTSLTSPQPKMRDTSMPSMTASLPALMTWRAWNGSVTMRNFTGPELRVDVVLQRVAVPALGS